MIWYEGGMSKMGELGSGVTWDRVYEFQGKSTDSKSGELMDWGTNFIFKVSDFLNNFMIHYPHNIFNIIEI